MESEKMSVQYKFERKRRCEGLMLKRHQQHCRPPGVEAGLFGDSDPNTGSCMCCNCTSSSRQSIKSNKKVLWHPESFSLKNKLHWISTFLTSPFPILCVCDGAKQTSIQTVLSSTFADWPLWRAAANISKLTLHSVCTAPTRPPSHWLEPENVSNQMLN